MHDALLRLLVGISIAGNTREVIDFVGTIYCGNRWSACVVNNI
ncbi:hypothetical protein [Teredinibacter purpureus]|nr:hypothetical protein [Teredinibacter purpureus]